MKLLKPRKPDDIEAYAGEVLGSVRSKAQFRKSRWCHDAWDTIMEAIKLESAPMRDAGPCAVRTYERLVEMAIAYLQAKPSIANAAELHAALEHDVEVLGLRFAAMWLLAANERARDPFTQRERRIVSIAIIHLTFLTAEIEKQLSDTS